jgi:hypothetical protein
MKDYVGEGGNREVFSEGGGDIMSKAVKIGVIGAGSAQFSLGLVRDLILTEKRQKAPRL